MFQVVHKGDSYATENEVAGFFREKMQNKFKNIICLSYLNAEVSEEAELTTRSKGECTFTLSDFTVATQRLMWPTCKAAVIVRPTAIPYGPMLSRFGNLSRPLLAGLRLLRSGIAYGTLRLTSASYATRSSTSKDN